VAGGPPPPPTAFPLSRSTTVLVDPHRANHRLRLPPVSHPLLAPLLAHECPRTHSEVVSPEVEDEAPLPRCFHGVDAVVLANVGDCLTVGYSVEDSEAGQGRSGPSSAPPPHAISTRWNPARGQVPPSASAVAVGSAGSQKSGHRNHRCSQGTGGGLRAVRYTPKAGTGSGGTGCRNARPRTSRPEGSRRTPAAAGSQVLVMAPA